MSARDNEDICLLKCTLQDLVKISLLKDWAAETKRRERNGHYTCMGE